jgi:hypothetical protein
MPTITTTARVQSETASRIEQITVCITDHQVAEFAEIEGISIDEARNHPRLPLFAESDFQTAFGGGF